MSEKKETEEFTSQESCSQAESYDVNKSGTSETYDMKDFCPGIRIEAKDFDGKWYPAKVSDVDWTENEILVHFENWNTKFDEWIPMDSSRLRPIQKPALQQKDSVKFSKGEEVMAVWSANQKYPGVIQAVLANDRYDVLFSDGFLKRLKGHKISKLQGDTVKAEVKNFTDIGTKEERRERKRKINVAELFHINKRPRKKGLVHLKSQDIKTYPVSKSRSKGSLVKKLLTPEEKKEDTSFETPEVKSTDDKLLNSSGSISNKALVDSIPAAFEVKYLNGQTETWSKQLYQRSEGRTAGKLDIVILNPQGRKFRSRNEIMKYCEENGIVYSHEAFDFSAKGRPKSKPILQTPPVKTEVSVEDKDKVSLKKGNKKSHDLAIGSQSLEVMPPFQAEVVTPENVVPNKVFIGDYEVVIENGKFICPVKICGKHFRRENLLHMHMKHYHPEFSKYLDYTPSVTDLAYARTVGNLDAAEVPSPAPRKLVTVEKPEKSSVKAENIRKPTEISNDSTKDAKKTKTNESRVESRSYAPKTSTDTPITSITVADESVEENTQKSKIILSSLQTGRNERNESETPIETKANPLEGTSNEPTPSDDKTLVTTHPVAKPSRHHRLHNRKKTSRFQSSFSEHMRKKRFISQDRLRSHNKMGRQQQTPHLKQQLQQPQQIPETIVSSYSPLEETNSNAFSTAYTMARYPKPQSNMTNEISGKNNLLTNCKTLSPVASKKNEQNKHLTVTGGADKSGGKYEETRETNSYQKNKENEKANPSVCNRRSFLAGLLSARKRKGKAIRKRLKKKKVNRIKSTNKDFKSGRSEYEEKPDETRERSVRIADKGSPVLHDVDHEGSRNKELPSRKESLKLKIKWLDVENMTVYDNNIKNDECYNPTEPKEHSRKTEVHDGLEIAKAFDVETANNGSEVSRKAGVTENGEYLGDSLLIIDQEKEHTLKNLPKSFVLLENVCRKSNQLKHANSSGKKNDENGRNFEVAGRRRREKRKKSRKLKEKKSMKKVRFENEVTEKWINVDEGEEYSVLASVGWEIGREDRKKKQRKLEFDYLNEREGNPQSDDGWKDEKSFTSINMSSLDQAEGTEDSKSPLALENDKIEKLRRNEIINCLCGITEEDGLMIQCDLCLCWQHGHCAGILRELDVPDKYTCAICKNPYRARSSMKYLHDQDWLKEGALPSLSFRSKRDDSINQRKTMLKRSHDLSGSITLLAQVIHSLRIKVNIAEKKDHPKLWLWAKKWTEKKPNRLKEESDIKEERTEEQNVNSGTEIKTEGGSQDEKFLPKVPEPEAPIDSAECRLNLLDHLIHYQTLVDARLSCIESLVAELESMQDDAVNDETPDRYPRTKATVQMILRDLNTMKKISMI